jgi:AcrR family transcriptional regulator
MLEAVMHTVSDKGYRRTRVEDITALAGVSRKTFYVHFANKEEAFLAAYDFEVQQLLADVGGVCSTGDTWASKVRLGLGALLGQIAAEPQIARACIVEVAAAGPDALQRRMAAMTGFRELLVPAAAACPRGTVSEVIAETVIGGVYQVIYARVVSHRTAELAGLMPALLYSSLLPLVGADIAAAEYRHAGAQAATRPPRSKHLG